MMLCVHTHTYVRTSEGLCSASIELLEWMFHDKMAATFSCSVWSSVTRMKCDKTKFEQTYTLRLSLVGEGIDCWRRRLTYRGRWVKMGRTDQPPM